MDQCCVIINVVLLSMLCYYQCCVIINVIIISIIIKPVVIIYMRTMQIQLTATGK
jgi:hypothetical protein